MINLYTSKMHSKTATLLVFFSMLSGMSILSAQSCRRDSLVIEPMFGDRILHMDSLYITGKGDSIRFETLKFYISNIELLYKGKTVWEREDAFHLLNLSDRKSLSIATYYKNEMEYDQIKFCIGIDSTTNVSGAMGGALDPTKGMYWAWQSGYINFKLEGKSSSCKSQKNEFQFHLGGYAAPYNALQTVIIDSTKNMKLQLDLKKLVEAIDFSKQDHIMSPGEKAVLLSKKLPELFSVQIP